MKFHSNKLLPAIAGLALFPLTAHADLESIMKVEVEGYVQDRYKESSSKTEGKVRKVRLDTKNLLKLLADRTSSRFPGGSQLSVTEDGRVTVVDSRGKFVANASPYIRTKHALGSRLFDGKYESKTGKENSTNYYRFTLTLNLPGVTGNLQGTAIEKYKVTVANRDGIQITTGNAEVDVNGKGKLSGKTGYYDGSVTLRGRSAAVSP